MIRVIVNVDGPNVSSVTIKGHANAATKGEDLVCAGVSSIGIGTLNALDLLVSKDTHEELSEGFISIEVAKSNPTIQTILQTMIIQLETMQHAHAEYIKITKQEV